VPKTYPKFAPLDASISDVQRLRGESRSTVLRKIEKGVYQSYLSGGMRKIVLASVYADRDAEIAANRKKLIPPNAKREARRPRKQAAAELTR
jgi:hypothetical protein